MNTPPPEQVVLSSRSAQLLGAELKTTADETLFLELALRGYDLTKLRDEPTTAEIVKIGELREKAKGIRSENQTRQQGDRT